MARYATWLLLGLCGVGAFILALDFGYGSGPRIGSAAFPLVLSGGLVLVSLWGLLFGRDEVRGHFASRPLLAVTAAVLVFILAVDRVGIIPSTVASMLVAYLGQTERGYLAFLVYAAVFAVVVWALFSFGLGLPIRAFGGF